MDGIMGESTRSSRRVRHRSRIGRSFLVRYYRIGKSESWLIVHSPLILSAEYTDEAQTRRLNINCLWKLESPVISCSSAVWIALIALKKLANVE